MNGPGPPATAAARTSRVRQRREQDAELERLRDLTTDQPRLRSRKGPSIQLSCGFAHSQGVLIGPQLREQHLLLDRAQTQAPEHAVLRVGEIAAALLDPLNGMGGGLSRSRSLSVTPETNGSWTSTNSVAVRSQLTRAGSISSASAPSTSQTIAAPVASSLARASGVQ